jgi:enoyl-CoA hydratase/carnithine racemase
MGRSSRIKMTVQTENVGAVRVLSLARPERKNALTADMYALLADGLLSAASDASVHVLMLTGNAAGFTAGNDLGDFLKNPPTSAQAPVFRFLHAIASFPKPLIAAVNGVAIGVGTTMLLHCDLVYASEDTKFSMPFTSLGLCPEAASSLLLPAIAGYARAAEKLLLGETFSAAEALEMGMVNRVVPLEQLREFALAQAQKLCAKPLQSLIETKRLMRAHTAALIPQVMAEEGKVFGRMLTEPAAREAFTAFAEKRPPDFSKC